MRVALSARRPSCGRHIDRGNGDRRVDVEEPRQTLREETGLPLAMAEDPLSSVVLGAGKMLSDFNLLRKISID